MTNSGFFLAAFIVVWVILFGYVFYLSNKQKSLQKEIDSLKESLKKK